MGGLGSGARSREIFLYLALWNIIEDRLMRYRSVW